MATMSKGVQEIINDVETAVFATCADGIPNAVPVNLKKVIDEHTVMVSDQFLNKSLANIQSNPQAALTVWKDGAGYQIKGPVTYENEGPRFEKIAEEVNASFKALGLPITSKGVCFIAVEEVYSVTPGPDAGALIS